MFASISVHMSVQFPVACAGWWGRLFVSAGAGARMSRARAPEFVRPAPAREPAGAIGGSVPPSAGPSLWHIQDLLRNRRGY